MQVSFIMVEPAVPENIGAAARALNTMGFEDLRLVNPIDHLSEKARWLAHGSVHLLEQAKVFTSMEEAIKDLDFVIGTTAKRRSVKNDYYLPEDARELTIKKGRSITTLGIIFGREECGLSNEELAKCDIASTINLKNPYPSLNLAQCVMLYSYVFANLSRKPVEQNSTGNGARRLYSELKEQSKFILEEMNIKEDSVLYRRMMERLSTANEDDVRLFLSFAKNFRRKFE